MAQFRSSPTSIVSSTNLTGTVSNIQDDPDSADAGWLTVTTANQSTNVQVAMSDPTGSPTTGSGLQNIRVLWRKTSQTTNPTGVVELWRSGGGAAIATIVSSTTVSSTTGVVVSGTFDFATFTAGGGAAGGSDLEIRVVGTVGGGSPSNRASVEIGAIEWNAEYSVAITLTGTNSSQANTSSAESITQAHALVKADSSQSNTSSDNTITQVQLLTKDDSTQANASSTNTISQVHVLVKDDSSQANTSSSVEISQSGTALTLIDLDLDNAVYDGQTAIIHVSNGGNTQGLVYIDDVAQTVNSWSDTEISINVIQGALPDGPHMLRVLKPI